LTAVVVGDRDSTVATREVVVVEEEEEEDAPVLVVLAAEVEDMVHSEVLSGIHKAALEVQALES
jgi:hypothetical protein